MRSVLRQFVRRVSYVQGQSPSPRSREYFYYIDHQGQLFLDDARVKNFITCFKDKKFLEFFFKRVKVNTSGRYEAEFPYISPCGRETNYIRCDDLPIVFSQLLDEDSVVVEDILRYGSSPSRDVNSNGINSKRTNREGDSRAAPTVLSPSTHPMDGRTASGVIHSPVMASLAYGGTLGLTVPFQPNTLCMLPATGRVYHAGPENLGGVGLVKSSLAIELSRFFVYKDGAGEHAHPVGFQWQGKTWQLDTAVLTRLKKLTTITEYS